MLIKIFTVPVLFPESMESALNQFLSSHKIMDVESELVSIQNAAYWTYSIKYMDKTVADNEANFKRAANKVDYKKKLSAAAFERFTLLRELRKTIAKEDAIPVFMVFNNAELAEIAKLEKLTEKSLLKIKGIGEKKVEIYAARIIEELKDKLNNET